MWQLSRRHCILLATDAATMQSTQSPMAQATASNLSPSSVSSGGPVVSLVSAVSDLKDREVDAISALAGLFGGGDDSLGSEQQLALSSSVSPLLQTQSLPPQPELISSVQGSPNDNDRSEVPALASLEYLSSSNASASAPMYGAVEQEIAGSSRKHNMISSYWSVHEMDLFPKLLMSYGSQWDELSKHLKAKSTTMVKNYYTRNAAKFGWDKITEEADRVIASGQQVPPPPSTNTLRKKHETQKMKMEEEDKQDEDVLYRQQQQPPPVSRGPRLGFFVEDSTRARTVLALPEPVHVSTGMSMPVSALVSMAQPNFSNQQVPPQQQSLPPLHASPKSQHQILPPPRTSSIANLLNNDDDVNVQSPLNLRSHSPIRKLDRPQASAGLHPLGSAVSPSSSPALSTLTYHPPPITHPQQQQYYSGTSPMLNVAAAPQPYTVPQQSHPQVGLPPRMPQQFSYSSYQQQQFPLQNYFTASCAAAGAAGASSVSVL